LLVVRAPFGLTGGRLLAAGAWLLREPAYLALAALFAAGVLLLARYVGPAANAVLLAVGWTGPVAILLLALAGRGAPDGLVSTTAYETPWLERYLVRRQLRTVLLMVIVLSGLLLGTGSPVLHWPSVHPFGGLFEAERLDPVGLGLRVLATYGLLPVAAVLVLGARLSDLGFRSPPVRSLATWTAILVQPLLVVASLRALGVTPSFDLGGREFAGLAIMAFAEELLFRGLLLALLARVIGFPWALAISSVAFGVIHVGAIEGGFYWVFAHFSTFGDYLGALGLTLVFQTTGGVLYGLAYRYTGSLIVPTAAHLAYNVALSL
jgi:membrane protease YdiL (CAAX protease family)